jgi:hypothetical protein
MTFSKNQKRRELCLEKFVIAIDYAEKLSRKNDGEMAHENISFIRNERRILNSITEKNCPVK